MKYDRDYLERIFGSSLFNPGHDIDNNCRIGLPYNSLHEKLYNSDKRIKYIHEKLDNAFEHSGRTIRKLLPGISRKEIIRRSTAILVTAILPSFTSSCRDDMPEDDFTGCIDAVKN